MPKQELKVTRPTPTDSEIARESIHQLANQVKTLKARQAALGATPVKIEIRIEDESELVPLPLSVLELLNDILVQMAAGHAISILPQKCELSTLQAADVLNVSRPHLTRLVDSGQIPHRKVGTHRRIPLDALLEFKQMSLQKQRQAAKEVGDLSRELGLEM